MSWVVIFLSTEDNDSQIRKNLASPPYSEVPTIDISPDHKRVFNLNMVVKAKNIDNFSKTTLGIKCQRTLNFAVDFP